MAIALHDAGRSMQFALVDVPAHLHALARDHLSQEAIALHGADPEEPFDSLFALFYRHSQYLSPCAVTK